MRAIVEIVESATYGRGADLRIIALCTDHSQTTTELFTGSVACSFVTINSGFELRMQPRWEVVGLDALYLV